MIIRRMLFCKLLFPILFVSFMFNSSLASVKEGQNKNGANAAAVSSYQKVTAGLSTAKILSVDKTVSIKFVNPSDKTKYITTSAGTFKADVDGSSASFYCVDLHHYLQFYTQDQPNTYTEQSSVDVKSFYIINNYYPCKSFPYTGSASSVQVEAAAVQVALWHYSDDLDETTVDNTNVRLRAQQIITDAEANASSFFPTQTLLITPANQSVAYGSSGSFFVSAYDELGNALSGVTVTLSTDIGVLSSYSVVTGTNGNTPAVTVSQAAGTQSIIKATAHTKLNPGTMFVHSSEPDKWQKLALATWCGSTQSASAAVNWYSPAACDTKGFTTFTQGGWGSSSTSTPGKIRDTYFANVFPTGLVIGGTYKLTLTNANAVKAYLPDGGTAAAYSQNYSNPTSKINVLSGQLAALKLNVAFSAAGYLGNNTTKLGSLQIAAGPFSGMTVSSFLVLAETAIGGGSLGGYTLSQFNDAATSINENFDNGCTDKGFLTCASTNVFASLGDKVWIDANKNGIQDTGETGLQGVTVKLFDCGNNLISTKTTDNSGNYLFSNLNPGSYYVQFILPAGYLFTVKNSGSDISKDSDADVSTGKTTCTTLTAGENDLTWDAGVYVESCKNKIGDLVWRDSNYNGVQDSGEPGIKGVTVELLQGASVTATTITDDNGKYEFSNLANGTYSVRIAASNYTAVGVLANSDRIKWYASPKNQGGDDTKDSDAAMNESVPVTLNCADNITVDFGFYKSCISVSKTANKPAVKPGDKITYTFVIENCGDIQFHGGIDVFDKMLNTVSPYKIKHVDLLDAGKSASFTIDYTVKSTDCGDLINEVSAEGHPVNGSAYVTDKATAKVYVDCGPACTTDWNVDMPGDQPLCEYNPSVLSVTGKVTLTPASSSGYLVTSWRITFPNDGSVDNSVKTATTQISGTTNFEIKPQWPGIRSGDQLVEVQYYVLVLDCNQNPLGKEVSHKFYWNSSVCNPPAQKTADLKIEKSSSTANPKCGDNLTYTVKVTNLGPADASSVQVTDVVPQGLSYQLYSATQGTYDPASGYWNVGNIANNGIATLTITVKVDCSLVNNSLFDLGAAGEYNLFVIQDLNQPSSDTEGKVAVGRDASLANYSVGDKLSDNPGDALVVGRNLTYTSGRVYGNAVYGNTTNLPIGQTSVDGTLRKDSPINFAAAKTYLENLSYTLSTYAANGTVTLQYSQLTLKGNDPHLNVFRVKGSDLAKAVSDSIIVPNGSAVLVNIEGDNFTWSGGLEVVGTAINNVLYNFYQATSVTIRNIDVRGSILAPFTAVTFSSGVQNGQMIAKSVSGQGQFNNWLFCGNIPTLNQITNIAVISGCLTNDTNTSNNSASVQVTINNSNTTPNTGNNGSGETQGTWLQVGAFGSGEIVYTLCYDNSGNTYAGTMGGKISRSADGGKTWVRINNDMNVGWIWSLAFYNNILFAGTEKGLYRLNGTSWVLTSLKSVDVRAVCYYGNALYAGTWGNGVYKSVDNGATWTEFNSGLENSKVIQALTADASGNIFAGTVGFGLFKLFTGETKWYKYDLGNNLISTLAVTSNAVFASTYGGGLYRSFDSGSNWEKVSLSQPYIYSTVVDKTNKIHISAWTGGVYTSTDNGSAWVSLGMAGFGVSCLITNSSTSQSEMMAGTTDGKIYKISFNTTGIEDKNVIPAEFRLEQNYPNPFNPSTTIKFALPKNAKVKLEIYNILGQRVAVLLDEIRAAGMHSVNWNAVKFASGVYIYKLEANALNGGTFMQAKKMLLIK